MNEHKQKLDEYKADPYKYDNRDLLKNARNEAERESIKRGREKHLQDEINDWARKIEENNRKMGKDL